ncbi:MAG: hypothetical protein D6B27_01845 [Gammaproteobacteria bacterium]|nr:MAG: hypothetical protein D6B27_01845 [Gammaproteobacteria bacterium]
MPLSANGKLDRKVLAKIEVVSKRRAEYVAPRNELEEALSDIWKELLGISKVGINDNFFELGGNSLTAVRLISMIEDVLEERIPLSEMFKAQTIADISKILHASKTNSDKPLIKIKEGGEKTIIFVHAIGGHLLSYNQIIENLSDEYSVYGIQFAGIDNEFTTIAELADIYTDKIRNSEINGYIMLIGHSIGGLLALEIDKNLSSFSNSDNHQIVLNTVMLDTFLPIIDIKEDLLTTYVEQLFGKRSFKRYLATSKKEFSALSEQKQLDLVVSAIEENSEIQKNISLFEDKAFVEAARRLLPAGLRYSLDGLFSESRKTLITAKGEAAAKSWRQQLTTHTKAIEIKEGSGDHDSMLNSAVTIELIKNAIQIKGKT